MNLGKLLGRWAPLVGGGVLVLSAVLRLLGSGELADTLLGLGGLFGLTGNLPVPAGELLAAVAVVVGIVRKFLAVSKPQA